MGVKYLYIVARINYTFRVNSSVVNHSAAIVKVYKQQFIAHFLPLLSVGSLLLPPKVWKDTVMTPKASPVWMHQQSCQSYC